MQQGERALAFAVDAQQVAVALDGRHERRVFADAGHQQADVVALAGFDGDDPGDELESQRGQVDGWECLDKVRFVHGALPFECADDMPKS